jgi:hypothetical protein
MAQRHRIPRNPARALARHAEGSQILVVGLGRFGSALAQELVALGFEVLGVDGSARRVQEQAEHLTHVVEADTTDPAVLRQLGAGGLPDRGGGHRHRRRGQHPDHVGPGGPRRPGHLGQGRHRVPRADPRAHRRPPRGVPGARHGPARGPPGDGPGAGLVPARRELRHRGGGGLLQDVDAAGRAEADHVGQADLGTLDLAVAGLAPEVVADLPDVGDAGGGDGVALGLQAAGHVDRHGPVTPRRARTRRSRPRRPPRRAWRLS